MDKLKIEYIDINELKPYKNNPRKNEEAVQYVINSIKEFGFKVPIIIDKDYTVVAGHTRLKAAKKLGIKQIPTIIADDLTKDQINAYRLIDNKTSELSFWDWEALDIELDNITTLDMTSFGFIDIQLDDIDKEIKQLNDLDEEKIRKQKTIICPSCGETIIL